MIFWLLNGCIWLFCMMVILLPLLFIVMVRGHLYQKLPDCGKLKFNNVGASLAVGAFQFSTTRVLLRARSTNLGKELSRSVWWFRTYELEGVDGNRNQSIYSGKKNGMIGSIIFHSMSFCWLRAVVIINLKWISLRVEEYHWVTNKTNRHLRMLLPM